MARLYAQLVTVVFALVGVGSLFLGTAGHPAAGEAGGNLGGITLHRTWERDVLDLALLAAFAYVGFVAARHPGRVIVTAVGAGLSVLGIAGFITGDDPVASKGFLGMHFPVAINVLDLVTGVLAVLAGLGTVEDPEPPPVPLAQR